MRAWSAVSAGMGNAAAASTGTPDGTTATCPAAAMNFSAQQPCSRSGSECVVTRSPTLTPSTEFPTAATIPAASTPSAIGGWVPVSQPPVRTNSSQLPAPHAWTSISTSSVRTARGGGSRSSSTGPPIWRTPAARILTTSFSFELRVHEPRVLGRQAALDPVPDDHHVVRFRRRRWRRFLRLSLVGRFPAHAPGEGMAPDQGVHGCDRTPARDGRISCPAEPIRILPERPVVPAR